MNGAYLIIFVWWFISDQLLRWFLMQCEPFGPTIVPEVKTPWILMQCEKEERPLFHEGFPRVVPLLFETTPPRVRGPRWDRPGAAARLGRLDGIFQLVAAVGELRPSVVGAIGAAHGAKPLGPMG